MKINTKQQVLQLQHSGKKKHDKHSYKGKSLLGKEKDTTEEIVVYSTL